MLNLQPTSQYRKDRKRAIKRGLPMNLLDDILQTLAEEKPLAPKHKDHALVGDYAGFRECHILPDWLLIYAVDKGNLILIASRAGSHSDLF
ncbi:MAG: type II toxin-antitoxin system YafQ family toxin [Peptococcaceae bacterium]|jgi:mRNA interferase YafQ|nr:type II toxin-antitoxin system YafQ family toxin [Peptococcaceae bacterium]